LQYAQDPLEEDDLDVLVLMWNIRRRVDPNAFGTARVTVHFDFTDVPQNKRRFWLVNYRGTADLCPFDPGFPVDIYITTDIRTMIRIWFAKLTLDSAIRSEAMEVIGSKQLQARLTAWFLLSPINMNTLTRRSPVPPSGDKETQAKSA
jgi:hypothetical protein